MNEDEMQALEPQAGETLERTLARYARVRLDPGAAESRRVRAAVMEEAWRRRFGLADAATAVPAGTGLLPRRRHGPFAGWGVRRITATLAAAIIAGLLIGSTAFATSRAGGPLYGTRLALEELALPSDPASRVEVEIAWEQSRLAEIVDASNRNDQGALSAALAAYERTTDSLGATIDGPADRALEAVASHRAVIARVAATAPASALRGLDRAIAASDAAMDHLAATRAGRPGDGDGGGAGTTGGHGGGNANGGGATNAGAGNQTGSGGGGAPNAGGGTGKPNGSHPSSPPKSDTTPKPRHTPDPKPSKAPGSRQGGPADPAHASPPTGKP